MKTLSNTGRRKIHVKLDIEWWHEFLPKFNGKSPMLEKHWSDPDQIWSSDACKTGADSWANGKYFHIRFPKFSLKRDLSINCLECITVIAALKTWTKDLERK